jgi:hypothetical protein
MKRVLAFALVLAAFSGTAGMIAAGIGCHAMPCCQRAAVKLVAPDPGCCNETPVMCAAPARVQRAVKVLDAAPVLPAIDVPTAIVAERSTIPDPPPPLASPTRTRLARLSTLLI